MGDQANPEELAKAAERLVAQVRELLRAELPDKITIGTPSKGGELVVYVNVSDPQRAKDRVDAALRVLEHARNGHASLSGA